MSSSLPLVKPRSIPPLDPGFRPAALANRFFLQQVEQCGVYAPDGRPGQPLVLGLERADGELSRFETRLFPDDHPQAAGNPEYAERLVKFLLWQRGGWRIYVGGPRAVFDCLKDCYAPRGERSFEYTFMGETVYERTFTLVHCRPVDVPPANEAGRALGRHLDGCRVGFDLGASDRKVSAVIDGQAVWSEEVVWEPRAQSDPEYHYREIMTAIRKAAAHLPRLEAVGGSAAGIYIDNRPMVASLFRGVPEVLYPKVRTLFLRIQAELGVPFEVINDGDVTALAGSMSLGENGILGIALGSSEAAGYVDPEGRILSWLSELAFAPIDYQAQAPPDPWSGDRGGGSQYLSQQCVFRLAGAAGLVLPQEVSDAERLRFVQEKLESGHLGAADIWKSMGIYTGYAMAHYASFYDIRHILLLGRCTSGSGGTLLLEGAREVLRDEFPSLAGMNIQLPDEKSRRVGQAIAAASLPFISKREAG